MANKTIDGLTETLGIANGDFLPVWKTALGQTRKISYENLVAGLAPALSSFGALSLPNDWEGVNNFDAGISLGDDTLSHYSQDPWTPVFADAASGGNVASGGTFEGWYVRFGPAVLAWWRAINVATVGMTGANVLSIRGLPFPSLNSANFRAYGEVFLTNVTFTGIPKININNNSSVIGLTTIASGAGSTSLTVAALTSGSATVNGTILYRTD